jgi:hypothetical protein
MNAHARSISLFLLLFFGTLAAGCATAPPENAEANTRASDGEAPPPAVRAWMDRLTVDHAYDPETGFIVAREVITLPPVIADGPRLDRALPIAEREGRTVIAFATADRCAPCQQYKKSALNDPRVIEALRDPELIATHVEVDKQPELARSILGSLAIPMTYGIRNGERIAMLRGQRSADELLAWPEEITTTSPDTDGAP